MQSDVQAMAVCFSRHVGFNEGGGGQRCGGDDVLCAYVWGQVYPIYYYVSASWPSALKCDQFNHALLTEAVFSTSHSCSTTPCPTHCTRSRESVLCMETLAQAGLSSLINSVFVLYIRIICTVYMPYPTVWTWYMQYMPYPTVWTWYMQYMLYPTS